MLEIKQVVALGVFTSYFLIIVALFSIIARTLLILRLPQTSSDRLGIWTFGSLALASFAHTWLYMFKFMAWSFTNYENITTLTRETSVERITSWLANTSLFEQAWAAVCFGPVNWWWSEQLCLFTVGAWTVFLATEGKAHHVKHLWAYMLLGQLVAISVASNLVYMALILTRSPSPKPPPKPSWAPPGLWISVLVSLAAVANTPFTTERTFLPNLLLMHALLVVPLLATQPPTSQKDPGRFSIRISTLYLLIFTSAFAMRVRTVLGVLASLSGRPQSPYQSLSAAWETLHSHPAQSSIGWDVIWTSVSFAVWVAFRTSDTSQAPKIFDVPYIVLASPLVSVGVTAPYVLRPRDAYENSKDE